MANEAAAAEATEETTTTPTDDAAAIETKTAEGEAKDASPNLADASKDSAEADKTTEKPDQKSEEKAPELPASADQYDFTIPEDLGLKDEKGDPLQFDKDDPIVAEARNVFFENKVPKEVASKMVGLYAKAMKETQEATLKSVQELSTAKIQAGLKKLESKDAAGAVVEGGVRVQRVLAGIDTAFGAGASKIIGAELTQPETVIELERWLAVINEGEVGKPKTDKRDRSAAERMYGDQT